jgi:hypothetical protein
MTEAVLDKRKFAEHRTVNHGRTYGVGDLQPTRLRECLSLLKRGVYGAFHKVSIKHLGRYYDEFSYASIGGAHKKRCLMGR